MDLLKATSAMSLAASVGLALIVPTSSGQAQDARADTAVSSSPSVTTATYGDWTLRCVSSAVAPPGGAAGASKQDCEIALSVRVKDQTQPIARLAIGRPRGKTDLIMAAVLPVNISLPGRVHVTVDAESSDGGGIDLSWTRCIPGACLADGRPGKAALEIMLAKPSGQLSFVDASGKTLGIPISWRGFSQAFRALQHGAGS